MFSELVKRNSRRSRRENGLFFASLLIAIIAFYIILSLSHQDVIVFLKTMESNAVNRLLTLVPALYVMGKKSSGDAESKSSTDGKKIRSSISRK